MERKFFGLVAALLVFLTGVLFAVNAPVQDVYNFDVRQSLDGLTGLKPHVKTELVELIQSAIAKNLDPSIEIPNFGKRLQVAWEPETPITKLELYVMAVKALGREDMALKLYPMVSPTFADIQTGLERDPFAVQEFLYQRAYGYAEYYQNFLLKEFPILMNFVPEPKSSLDITGIQIKQDIRIDGTGTIVYTTPWTQAAADPKANNAGVATLQRTQATRAEVIEFIVRLAQVKYPELFSSVSLEADVTKALDLENKGIVAVSEALSKHLRTLYGQSYPENVGFVYAFEFFFLSEMDTAKDGKVAAPLLYLDTFRSRIESGKNVVLNENYGANRTVLAANPAERFWAVALFAKVFAAEKSKVESNMKAPERIINNVIAFKPVGVFKGQVMFNKVDCVEGEVSSILCAGCKDAALGAAASDIRATFLKLKDGKYYVLTDMTVWDSNNGYPNGIQFANTYCADDGVNTENPCEVGIAHPQSVTTEKSFTLEAIGFGTIADNKSRMVNVDKIWIPLKQQEAYEKVKNVYGLELKDITAKYPKKIESGAIDLYRLFFPNIEDITQKGRGLERAVDMIIYGKQGIYDFDLYVKRAADSVPVNDLLKGGKVVFNISFNVNPLDGGVALKKVELLPAIDRLNHRTEVLTLKGVKDFVDLYAGLIDTISTDPNQPMVAYYKKLVEFAKEHNIPDSAQLVAIIKTPTVDREVQSTTTQFKMMELVLGQLIALELKPGTDAKLCDLENANAFDPGSSAAVSTCFGEAQEEYAINKLNQTICEKEAEAKKVFRFGDIVEDCCVTLAKGYWAVKVDPYLATFLFHENTKVALFNDLGLVSVGNVDLLRLDFLGFKGPIVREAVLVKPLDPLNLFPARMAESKEEIYVKAYEVK